MQQAKLQI